MDGEKAKFWKVAIGLQIVALVVFALALVAIAYGMVMMSKSTDDLKREVRVGFSNGIAEVQQNRQVNLLSRGDIAEIRGFLLGFSIHDPKKFKEGTEKK